MQRIALALASLVALTASSSSLATQQYQSTFRGDGFDASLYSYDGCLDVSMYFNGSDYAQKSGPGQPLTSNYLFGYVQIFDCETQSFSWAYIDQINASIDAKGPNATSRLSGSFEVEQGRWEPTGEQFCYTYEGWCWTDWDGNEVCEEGGEYCYDEYVFVLLSSKTLTFDLSLAPSGDAYRGMSMSSAKGPYGMYRSRYTGTQRYGDVTGTLTLDGEDLMAGSYSWANVWTATSGSVSVYTE